MKFENQAYLIKSMKQKRRLTHEQMAEAAGSHIQEISNWVRGVSSIPPKKARNLAKALNISFRNFASAYSLDMIDHYERRAGVK